MLETTATLRVHRDDFAIVDPGRGIVSEHEGEAVLMSRGAAGQVDGPALASAPMRMGLNKPSPGLPRSPRRGFNEHYAHSCHCQIRGGFAFHRIVCAKQVLPRLRVDACTHRRPIIVTAR